MILSDLIPFLKKVREYKGWTAEDLALRAGLLPHLVVAIENNTLDPYLSQIAAMTTGLELSVFAVSDNGLYFVLVLPRSLVQPLPDFFMTADKCILLPEWSAPLSPANELQSGRQEHQQDRALSVPALLDGEEIDLDIAMRKLRELQLQDGDIGAAYWLSIAKLLTAANGFKNRAVTVEKTLKQVRRDVGTV